MLLLKISKHIFPTLNHIMMCIHNDYYVCAVNISYRDVACIHFCRAKHDTAVYKEMPTRSFILLNTSDDLKEGAVPSGFEADRGDGWELTSIFLHPQLSHITRANKPQQTKSTFGTDLLMRSM